MGKEVMCFPKFIMVVKYVTRVQVYTIVCVFSQPEVL